MKHFVLTVTAWGKSTWSSAPGPAAMQVPHAVFKTNQSNLKQKEK